jgi:hypothetical protein
MYFGQSRFSFHKPPPGPALRWAFSFQSEDFPMVDFIAKTASGVVTAK